MYNTNNSLSNQICELLDLNMHTPEFDLVFAYCLEHIAHKTRIREFHTKLSSIVDFKQLDITPSKFRLIVSKSGYVLLNLRFYSCYMSKMRNPQEVDFDYFSYQYDISPSDTAIFLDLYEKNINGKKLKTILKKAPGTASDYSKENIEQIQEDFNLMLPELRKHCKRVIYKKLRFLMNTFNITFDEFNSELLFSGIKAHYFSHPNKNSIDRQLGKLRAAIHNHAINEIDKYTTSKRERIVNEGKDSHGNNVFSLKVMAQSQMNLIEGSDSDTEVDYGSLAGKSVKDAEQNAKEIKFSLRELTKKYGSAHSKTKLARIYVLENCCIMSAWLHKNRYMRARFKTTNDFLKSKTHEEQIKIISEYIRVSPEFLTSVALPKVAKELGIL